ncbi:PTS sugar transporter subunit IIA [Sutcliffiella sp. NC1]|uniref:PTS sugar transporter subunit IIA n=1 Tax=Sutcliffiella sp. NC1 TaxID=3004096 RepID=UPI0022DDCC92|nr:PTS glucose transporter subunit IIA [Sutcliffiella sp. NC1]WBL14674.1 PTS glucose transporter subunit IIA [Sutcliffiella sp. NC1]
MFKKLFNRKKEASDNSVYAPLTGEVVPLEEVPDPVFAEKMMGEGIAIKPTSGMVVSPVDGKIVQVFPTKHAVGIETSNGVEILIHIGLETVQMNGEGFTAHVQEGSRVSVGDKLISFDLSIVQAKAKSTITPIIITNTDLCKEIQKESVVNVTAGQERILSVIK